MLLVDVMFRMCVVLDDVTGLVQLGRVMVEMFAHTVISRAQALSSILMWQWPSKILETGCLLVPLQQIGWCTASTVAYIQRVSSFA
jgi:hypothetical protein